MQFRVIVVTDPQTNTQTNKQTGPFTLFTLFVDSSTENQLNILFVCMVSDDNINYLRMFIMLKNKEYWISIHNLHLLKSYSV